MSDRGGPSTDIEPLDEIRLLGGTNMILDGKRGFIVFKLSSGLRVEF